MAAAEPYVAQHIKLRGRAAVHVRNYFEGATKGTYVVFGAFALLAVVTTIAPLVAPFDPLVSAGSPMAPPNADNPLGTDDLGRDILSRVLVGMQTSTWGALIVVASGILIGGLIGLVSGAQGGWLDSVLMRLTDVILALPGPVLVIALVAALGRSYLHVLIGIAIVWWPLYARIVRAEVRKIKASSHVDAARLAGIGQWRLLRRHLLPGAVPVVIVTASLDVGSLVLTLAGLSFLGLGAPQPAPELGAMTAHGLPFLFTAWWISFMPAAAVTMIAVIANLAGDAFRDRIRDR